MIHPSADVQGTAIGEAIRIRQFVVVLANARIDRDCSTCSRVLIENDGTIGDRVMVKSGVQLWGRLHMEDDFFGGPNVTFTNEPFPRSKQYPRAFAVTTGKAGASVGGSDRPARYNDRLWRHARRRCGGDEVGGGLRGGRRQPGARRALPRGQR